MFYAPYTPSKPQYKHILPGNDGCFLEINIASIVAGQFPIVALGDEMIICYIHSSKCHRECT
jgi:hypothetical protein